MASSIHTSVAAAILAGGRAQRFGGQDKCRLVVEGRSIIERQLEILHRLTDRVLIVADDAARFADLQVPVEPDRLPGTGPLGGLYTALTSASAERVVVVACDLPFLNAALLGHLERRARGADGAWVRTLRGADPLLACYGTAAAPRVRAQIDAGELALHALKRVLRMETIGEEEVAQFGPPDRLLTNVNTPDDFARVQYRSS